MAGGGKQEREIRKNERLREKGANEQRPRKRYSVVDHYFAPLQITPNSLLTQQFLLSLKTTKQLSPSKWNIVLFGYDTKLHFLFYFVTPRANGTIAFKV